MYVCNLSVTWNKNSALILEIMSTFLTKYLISMYIIQYSIVTLAVFISYKFYFHFFPAFFLFRCLALKLFTLSKIYIHIKHLWRDQSVAGIKWWCYVFIVWCLIHAYEKYLPSTCRGIYFGSILYVIYTKWVVLNSLAPWRFSCIVN